MAYGVIGTKRWSKISNIRVGDFTDHQGWNVIRADTYGAYIDIKSPCGTTGRVYNGTPKTLANVLVVFNGLGRDANVPYWYSPLVYAINIPAGSCKIYGTIPDPPEEGALPPMDYSMKVGKCFDYFRYNNKQWDGQYDFDGEDFFGKPKT